VNYAHGSRRLRTLIPVLVLAVSCQSTVETTTSTTETTAPPPTTTHIPATTVPETQTAGGEIISTQEPGRIYRMGWYGDVGHDNTLCGDPTSVGARAADTRPSLYEVAMPGLNVVPDLAVPAEPPEPQLFGDTWVVDVRLRDDAVWSDGESITADDLVFTFDLHADLPWTLGGCFGQEVGVLDVEAIDPHVVRITFNGEPGLGIWPHGIGMAEILAEHFWGPHLVAAEAAGRALIEAIYDPAAAVWEEQQEAAIRAGDEYTRTVDDITTEEIDTFLYQAERREVARLLKEISGIGEPSGGPLVFAEWDPAVSIRYEANRNYYRTGDLITSGNVTYEIGPFIDEQQHITFGGPAEAALALLAGDIDQLWLPFVPAIEALLEQDPNITLVTNPVNVIWYLGLNLRKPPMSDLAFRRALAMMIDRDFLTGEVLQDSIPPAWTLLPEANLEWFDADAAGQIASKYRNLDRFERLEKAVRILEEAGYTWDEKPTVGLDERGEPSVEPGSGLLMPDETPAPTLEVLNLSPGSGGYVSSFKAYSLYIERWLHELGFTAETRTSRGQYVIERVWPGVGVEPTFDMVVIGWGLGNPAFPAFYESFFHSRNLAEVNDGNNATGYSNPELDALADSLYEVKTVEEAEQVMWRIEAIIDRDLPYIVLLNTVSMDAYQTRVEFPFTNTLEGLSYDPAVFHLVRIRE
jgi:ABC-type transport system substrate-binding protein